jgi:hypothetical protein
LNRSRGVAWAAGAGAGLVAGWLLARQEAIRHRHDLFHPRPSRRLAALRFLAGVGNADTIRVLRDYLDWESRPALRCRAQTVVRRLEATLS